MRCAMRRNRVDLPHPDGPISDTNSPGSTARSTSTNASTRFGRPSLNTFDTRLTSTAVTWSSLVRFLRSVPHQDDVDDDDHAVERESHEGGAEDGGVDLGGIARGGLAVRDHRASDAAADPGRDLRH